MQTHKLSTLVAAQMHIADVNIFHVGKTGVSVESGPLPLSMRSSKKNRERKQTVMIYRCSNRAGGKVNAIMTILWVR